MKHLLLASALVTGLAFTATAAHADHHGDKSHKEMKAKADIIETASQNESFSTLVTAIKAADLVAPLQGDGPFTVFAPTNEAFEKLPDGTLESLLQSENKERLQAILTYHVVPGKIMSSDIQPGTTEVDSLQGQAIEVMASDDGVMVDEANVVKTDIKTSNGVIHVIDTVIIPE